MRFLFAVLERLTLANADTAEALEIFGKAQRVVAQAFSRRFVAACRVTAVRCVVWVWCGCGCARTPQALVHARARRRLAQSLSSFLLRARPAALTHAHPTAVFGALASSDEVVKALNALPRAEAAASPHASPARADAHAPAITVTTLPAAPALSLTPQVVVAMMASAFLAGAACASAVRAR